MQAEEPSAKDLVEWGGVLSGPLLTSPSPVFLPSSEGLL